MLNFGSSQQQILFKHHYHVRLWAQIAHDVSAVVEKSRRDWVRTQRETDHLTKKSISRWFCKSRTPTTEVLCLSEDNTRQVLQSSAKQQKLSSTLSCKWTDGRVLVEMQVSEMGLKSNLSSSRLWLNIPHERAIPLAREPEYQNQFNSECELSYKCCS